MAAESNGVERAFIASLRAIYRTLPAGRRRQLWLVLTLSLFGGLAELATIGAIIPFLSLLATGDQSVVLYPGFSPGNLVPVTAVFIAAAIIAGLVRLVLAWQSLSFVQQLGHDVATDIQRRVLFQPYSYHLTHHSSELIASLELVDQLAYGVIQQLVQAVAATVIMSFVVVGIALIDARTAGVAALAFGLAYGLIALMFRSKLRSRAKVIASAYNERVQLAQESVGGIRDAIIDQTQTYHVEAFRRVDERLTKARTETALASAAPRFLIESAGLTILALVALGLSQSAGGLTATLPVVGALALGAQRLLPLANQLYHGWSLAAANHSLAAKVAELLALPLPAHEQSIDPLGFNHSINVRDVSFSYPGRTEPALESVSVTIPRGARVALTGKSGSGKTTFADLLMGLLEPTRGVIDVDGRALDGASRLPWQRSIAHVPQSIFLVDGTIARNIILSDPQAPYDVDRVKVAASIAQLEPLLARLDDGLDTMVGERGVRLSGGQRQRIGIARALFKQASLLVLDEATSALDEDTEANLLAALFAARPDLTIIVIAHRRSTQERCNIRLHIEDGKLTELS